MFDAFVVINSPQLSST